MVESVKSRVDEETASSDIAYLPSGFVPIQKAFTAMAKVKKRWGLNVLDKESDYHLHVEDKLKISVPKKHLHTFKQESGINDFGAKEIDLSRYTAESVSVIEEQSYNTSLINQVEDAFYELLAKSPISALDEDLFVWSEKLPGRYLPVKKALMNVDMIEEDIDSAMKQIELKLSDDRGELELLLSALQTQKNMARFDVFGSFKYLWAGVVESNYKGAKVIFECLAGMDFAMSEKIYVLNNRAVLDTLERTTLVKIKKNVIYPVGGRFQQNFFITLKNAIDEQ
jgi:hypothetical protein